MLVRWKKAAIRFRILISIAVYPRNKLGLNLDRNTYLKRLDQVRVNRNDVMHLDPDGISEDALDTLRLFAKFLERLARLQSDKTAPMTRYAQQPQDTAN